MYIIFIFLSLIDKKSKGELKERALNPLLLRVREERKRLLEPSNFSIPLHEGDASKVSPLPPEFAARFSKTRLRSSNPVSSKQL
jgi:hypothetical protein